MLTFTPEATRQRLTATQEKALHYICQKTHNSSLAPTLRELCEHMGYSAIGSAQDLAKALKKKGYLIEPKKQAARGTLLPSPQALELFGFSPYSESESLIVPCLGEVPAGNPLEAVGEKIDDLVISYHMLPKPTPKPSSLFALKAKGDSMINAGILSGDWLVVKAVNEANRGEIVVARLDGDATVKRLERDKANGWYLQPENPEFDPIYSKDQPFEIIGQVLSIQRFL